MTKSERLVYEALAAAVQADGLAHLSQSELIGRTGLARSTVQAALRSLADADHIDLVSKGHRGEPSYYAVRPIATNVVAIRPDIEARIRPDNEARYSPEIRPETLIEQHPRGESDPHVNRLRPSVVGNVGWGQSPLDKTPKTENPSGLNPRNPEWHPSQRHDPRPAIDPTTGRHPIPEPVAAIIDEIRHTLRVNSARNRFRKWDRT